jgi:hypothetical protein
VLHENLISLWFDLITEAFKSMDTINSTTVFSHPWEVYCVQKNLLYHHA